jgi:hypothetical protein
MEPVTGTHKELLGESMAKPFSPELYANNDYAKDIVINWLNTDNKNHASVNPDQYGIDVICKVNNHRECFYEVEVKHNWSGPKFPFGEVHFPARKQKFAKKHPEDSTFFVMLNSEHTHALIVDGFDFNRGSVIRKNTSVMDDDFFVEIPIFNCKFITLVEESNE